jgi:hypothetical protein
MSLDIVVSNIRWWVGAHREDGVPLYVAENPECSTVCVDPALYVFSRVVDGRRLYVLKSEYRGEE